MEGRDMKEVEKVHIWMSKTFHQESNPVPLPACKDEYNFARIRVTFHLLWNFVHAINLHNSGCSHTNVMGYVAYNKLVRLLLQCTRMWFLRVGRLAKQGNSV